MTRAHLLWVLLALYASLTIAGAHTTCAVAQPVITRSDICKPDELRQIEQRAQLLQRLRRDRGKWNARHPRYRLLDALHAYLKHHELVGRDVDRWRSMYKNIPKDQRKLLERTVRYSQKLNTNDHLLEKNKGLQEAIVSHALAFYDIERKELDAHIAAAQKEGREPEKIAVAQALKHFVRDWALEGNDERNDAFPCVLRTLLTHSDSTLANPARVLLPGAGLGRLGHTIDSLGGFTVTLNEYSAYMNIAYRFVESLSFADAAGLHPFIDTWSHHASTADMQRRVAFPDHAPSRAVVLVEGDFTTVFKGQEGTFDFIVTLFFIDTARNLLAYLRTIHTLLAPGGMWINFGPLLYGSGPWVQLSLDEVVELVEAVGFEFLEGDTVCGGLTLEGKKVRGRTAGYAFNKRALAINAYKAQSWAVKKVR